MMPLTPEGHQHVHKIGALTQERHHHDRMFGALTPEGHEKYGNVERLSQKRMHQCLKVEDISS